MRQKYRGFWQEAVIGFLGSWLMSTTALVIIGVDGHMGWSLLFTPVLFIGVLWIAQEMDAQKQQRDGAGEPTGKTA